MEREFRVYFPGQAEGRTVKCEYFTIEEGGTLVFWRSIGRFLAYPPGGWRKVEEIY
jgi:hypothetical protein